MNTIVNIKSKLSEDKDHVKMVCSMNNGERNLDAYLFNPFLKNICKCHFNGKVPEIVVNALNTVNLLPDDILGTIAVVDNSLNLVSFNEIKELISYLKFINVDYVALIYCDIAPHSEKECKDNDFEIISNNDVLVLGRFI